MEFLLSTSYILGLILETISSIGELQLRYMFLYLFIFSYVKYSPEMLYNTDIKDQDRKEKTVNINDKVNRTTIKPLTHGLTLHCILFLV